jgi:hypothetical protein
MSNGYPGPHGRERAIELNAPEARTLLKADLPFAVISMTPAQLGQVQKVHDAAVVNPSVP